MRFKLRKRQGKTSTIDSYIQGNITTRTCPTHPTDWVLVVGDVTSTMACTIGTNELIGTDPRHIAPALHKLYAGEWKKGAIPPLWDGHAAERIVQYLV